MSLNTTASNPIINARFGGIHFGKCTLFLKKSTDTNFSPIATFTSQSSSTFTFEIDPQKVSPLLTEINSILDKQIPPILADPRETAENFKKREKRHYKEYDDSLKQPIETAKNEARDRLTQQPIWNVGIGTSLVSSSGKYYDLRGDGMGIWSTYKTGVGGKSELRLHSNYRSGERIADRKGAFFNGNTLTLAAQVRIALLKDANETVNKTASSLYAFITPFATAITGYFFISSGTLSARKNESDSISMNRSAGENTTGG